jgi:hypothetical protein
VAPQARRLTNKNGASVREYIKHVTKQCHHHRIQERFNCITTKLKLEPITPDDAMDMETLDAQKIKAQTGGELRCRKIQKPALPFSPPIRDLDLRRWAYVNLVKWHEGDQLVTNMSFERPEAMRHGIAHPKSSPWNNLHKGQQRLGNFSRNTRTMRKVCTKSTYGTDMNSRQISRTL